MLIYYASLCLPLIELFARLVIVCFGGSNSPNTLAFHCYCMLLPLHLLVRFPCMIIFALRLLCLHWWFLCSVAFCFVLFSLFKVLLKSCLGHVARCRNMPFCGRAKARLTGALSKGGKMRGIATNVYLWETSKKPEKTRSTNF